MKIEFSAFMGVVPRLSPELLPANAAQNAENCKLYSGEIRPLRNAKFTYTPTKVGTIKSLHLMNGKFLHWTADVNAVRGPIKGDTLQRTYYTGDGVPKVTNNTLAVITDPGGLYPEDFYTLGIPAPLLAPTLAEGSVYTWTLSSHTNVAGAPVEITFTGGPGFAPPVDSNIKSAITGLTYRVIEVKSNVSPYVVAIDLEGGAVTLSGTFTQTYTVDQKVDSVYVYTYVSGWGEEGPPSPVATITKGFNQQVNITTPATPPAGDYNITHKRIYRKNTSTIGFDYQFVEEVTLATATYGDTLEDGDLGALLVTTTFDPPPTDMKGLIMAANGVMVGFSGGDICPSEPFLPYAYPTDYRIPVGVDIVALGAAGESIIVLTKGQPHIVYGSSPDIYASRPLEGVNYPCVSGRGVVDFGQFILYPTTSGIAMVDGSGNGALITEPLFTVDEWNALAPTSILGCRYDNRYIGFYDTGIVQGSFVFDPKEPQAALTFTDIFATAAYTDPESGKLYLVVNGNVVEWDADVTFKTYKWKSKPVYIERPVNLSVGRVYASSYPLTMKVYADDLLIHTESVTGDKPFYLPTGFKAKKWEAEVSGTTNVKRIALANSLREISL